ncbi:hypothetical protein GUITHDRAFT_154155 [Guillardia theta CCMP2712]|uniref:Uncharacterized protein n=1 Tax=Guillardia theta (strain CCMP2712) TaxID=905079 RepID=L1IW69_GUITC|nr:hypothetical protein GUITHDRAFT_154155 [Guillardia theta CCMP2712]EKX40322.1 hypothetical protein GUITHDRAFT_154155 [Guillardia theta CCMP2712]|eukprot:XP_005827302.1 hypothetical protein GUITHDRAFT_154155 [Guillardia theta CCMP2712]
MSCAPGCSGLRLLLVLLYSLENQLLDDALDELELLGLITRPQTWLLTNSRRQL